MKTGFLRHITAILLVIAAVGCSSPAAEDEVIISRLPESASAAIGASVPDPFRSSEKAESRPSPSVSVPVPVPDPIVYEKEDSDRREIGTKRYALVIGNEKYADGRVESGIEDALHMKKVLEDLGFEVEYHENLRNTQFTNVLTSFSNKVNSERDSFCTFYYSGRTAAIDGMNYIVPVDAKLDSAIKLQAYGYEFSLLKQLLHAGSQVLIIDSEKAVIPGVECDVFVEEELLSDTTGYLFVEKIPFDEKSGVSASTRIIGDELMKSNRTLEESFRRVVSRLEIMKEDEGFKGYAEGTTDILFSSEFVKSVLSDMKEMLARLDTVIGDLRPDSDEMKKAVQDRAALSRGIELYNLKLKEFREREERLSDAGRTELSEEMEALIENAEYASDNSRFLSSISETPSTIFSDMKEYDALVAELASVVSTQEKELSEMLSVIDGDYRAAYDLAVSEPLTREDVGVDGRPLPGYDKKRQLKLDDILKEWNAAKERAEREVISHHVAKIKELTEKTETLRKQLDGQTVMLSTLFGDLRMNVGFHDSAKEGWPVSISTDNLTMNADLFRADLMVPYSMMSSSSIRRGMNHDEAVEFLDELIARGIPFLRADMKFRVYIDSAGAVFDPVELTITRTDAEREGTVVFRSSRSPFRDEYGCPYFLFTAEDPIMAGKNTKADIDITGYSSYFDDRIVDSSFTVRQGSVYDGYLMDDRVLSASEFAVLPVLSRNGEQVFHGWKSNQDGKSYETGRIVPYDEFSRYFRPEFTREPVLKDFGLTLVGTSDGDMIVRPGETATFKVNATNSGNALLSDVQASVKAYDEEAVSMRFGKLGTGASLRYDSGEAFEIRIPRNEEEGIVPIEYSLMAGGYAPVAGTYELQIVPNDVDIVFEGMSAPLTEDGDSEIEQGEQLIIDLSFMNRGKEDCASPRLELSSSNPHVEVIKGKSEWERLGAGLHMNSFSTDSRQKHFYSGDYLFYSGYILRVDEDAPVDEPITIDWKISAQSGHADWTGSFTFFVNEKNTGGKESGLWNEKSIMPYFELGAISIDSSETGDRDINAGETAEVSLDLSNTGIGSSANTMLTLRSLTPGVEVVSGYSRWDKVEKGSLFSSDGATEREPFVLKVVPSMKPGTTIDLEWSITGDNHGAFKGTASLPVSEFGADIVYQGKIVQSDNGDDEFNRGENVTVDFYFRNDGKTNVLLPEVKAFCAGKGLKIVNQGPREDSMDGILRPGEVYDHFAVVEVAPDAAIEEVFTLSTVMLNVSGDSWEFTDSDMVRWVDADIVLDGFKVLTTSSGDDRANPNEKIMFDLMFRNDGPSSLRNAKLVLSTRLPALSIKTTEREWPVISSGKMVNWSSYDIVVPEWSDPDNGSFMMKTGFLYSAEAPIVLEWKITAPGAEGWSGRVVIPVYKK